MRALPSIEYCHSLVLGCQCISRMPPGSTSTSAAEIVFDAGNTLVSVMRTVPLLVLIGCCASILWLKVGDTGTAPAILSESSDPGTAAAKMESSLGFGTWSQ